MALATILKLLLTGGLIGVTSGLLGIGGGVLVIPMLVLVFGYTPQRAVGTSLAMLLPPIAPPPRRSPRLLISAPP